MLGWGGLEHTVLHWIESQGVVLSWVGLGSFGLLCILLAWDTVGCELICYFEFGYNALSCDMLGWVVNVFGWGRCIVSCCAGLDSNMLGWVGHSVLC